MSYDAASPLSSVLDGSQMAVPEWSLHGDGHVIAATIVPGEPTIEARILLDGRLLYRSRHATRAAAAAELVALRGQWAREGWVEGP